MDLTAQAILDKCEIQNVIPFRNQNLEAYSSSISIKIPMINGKIYFDSIMENDIVTLEITKNISKNVVTITEMTSRETSAAKLLPLIERKFGNDTKMEVLRGLYKKTLDKVRGQEVY
jgi:hypothetical protein